MSTYVYDEIVSRVQSLSPDEKLQLLADIAGMLRHQPTSQPEHSIMELKGLGKQVWQGSDVEKYIDAEPKRSKRPKHSILELEGLGKEIWEGIDAQEYVNQERDAWHG